MAFIPGFSRDVIIFVIDYFSVYPCVCETQRMRENFFLLAKTSCLKNISNRS